MGNCGIRNANRFDGRVHGDRRRPENARPESSGTLERLFELEFQSQGGKESANLSVSYEGVITRSEIITSHGVLAVDEIFVVP